MFRRQASSRDRPPFSPGPFSPSLIPSLGEMGKRAALALLREFSERALLPGLALADCTCGNGHDSLFLARALQSLKDGEHCPIIALDIQQAALDAAAVRLGSHARRVRLVLQGHEELGDALARHAPDRRLGLAVYNLGFLPGGGKEIITRPEQTLASLRCVQSLLTAGGLVIVHAYGGHPGGGEECEAVRDFFAGLEEKDWRAAEYSLCNKRRNPESLFLARRREEA